jgi:uncharacterized protein
MWEGFAMALLLGLASSLHCVGMCGPLALALPKRSSGGRMAPLIYHVGRIVTYTLGGLCFGLMGRGVYLAGWQQGLSIVLGVMILVVVIVRWLPVAGGMRRLGRWRHSGRGYFGLLQRVVARFWEAPSLGAVGLLGMINGLLPCGMVYLAIAGALTRPGVGEAMGFMAFFGLGTLPLLLLLQYAGHGLGASFRLQLRRVLPFVTVVVAVLLILRGLDLGIPFVSPLLAKGPGHVVECH